MQVKELSDCVDVDQIENALKTVPESLEATYTKVLCQIPDRNREKARFMLLLIAYSFKPLSLGEVAAAASLPEPNDVLNICTSTFISTDQERPRNSLRERSRRNSLRRRSPYTHVLRLDHFSVKEYLISNSIQNSTARASYFHKSEQLAHLTLGEALVSLLIRTCDQTPSLDLSWRHSASLEYPTMNWFRHAREGQTRELRLLPAGDIHSTPKASTFGTERKLLVDETHNLFRVEFSAAYVAWATAWAQWNKDFRSGLPNRGSILKEPILRSSFPPLFCVSMLGLRSHVERLLDDGADIDARSHFLPYHEEVLSEISLTALQLAAFEGHLDVLSALLGKGAAITQKDLELIAANGKTNLEKVLQLLLSEKEPDLVINGPLVLSVLSNTRGRMPDVLAFLLSTCDNIEIDCAIIVTAINRRFTSDVLLLLLNYCKGSIELDGACVTLETELTPAQVKLLFNCPKIVAGIEERCSIYRMSLEKAALLGSEDSEYLGLLSEFGLDIGAKELRQVVHFQAYNIAVSKALLIHVGYHMIDEGLLLAAGSNIEAAGHDLMRFLLKHLQRDLVITEQFLEAVTFCQGTSAVPLMEYALQHKSDEVEITESIIVAAVENSDIDVIKEMIELLVNTIRQKPELGPAMIKAATRRSDHSEAVGALETVLELMGPKVLISEELIEEARNVRRHYRKRFVEVLEKYKSKQVVELVDDDA